MKAYYGDRFSPHMTRTPEGYLICHDVPIARCGEQQYLPQELGLSGENIITVYRNEDEVFKTTAIASFEGKPVTDNHPSTDVKSDNYNIYTKGVVQNVHRGKNDLADKLLADLFIYDAILIAEIESGKREISCGYDCDYVDNNDGTFYQANILGNHVAVVDRGRAGHTVSIRDEEPKGVSKMGKKENIFKRMYNKFVKDAEPDEIAEATRAIDSLESEPNEPNIKNEEERKDSDTLTKILDALGSLNQRIEAVEQRANPKEENALDALENELTNETTDEPDEASVTVSPEQINDEEEMEKEKPVTTDKAMALNIIRAMKPVVAELPKEQRKKMSDSLSKIVRDAMQVKSTQPINGGYGALANQKKTVDSMTNNLNKHMTNNLNKQAFGNNCRKRNPHFKQ